METMSSKKDFLIRGIHELRGTAVRQIKGGDFWNHIFASFRFPLNRNIKNTPLPFGVIICL